MHRNIKAAPPAVRAGRASLTSLVTLVSGIITSLLVSEVPAWHNGLPYFVAYLIPVLVAAAGAFITHYVTKQPVTLAEVEAFLAKFGKLASSQPVVKVTSTANAPDMEALKTVMKQYADSPLPDPHTALFEAAKGGDDSARAALFAHEQAETGPVTGPSTETTPGMGSNAKTEAVPQAPVPPVTP